MMRDIGLKEYLKSMHAILIVNIPEPLLETEIELIISLSAISCIIDMAQTPLIY